MAQIFRTGFSISFRSNIGQMVVLSPWLFLLGRTNSKAALTWTIMRVLRDLCLPRWRLQGLHSKDTMERGCFSCSAIVQSLTLSSSFSVLGDFSGSVFLKGLSCPSPPNLPIIFMVSELNSSEAFSSPFSGSFCWGFPFCLSKSDFGGGHHTVAVLLLLCVDAAGAQQWDPAEIRSCGPVTVENFPLQICTILHKTVT